MITRGIAMRRSFLTPAKVSLLGGLLVVLSGCIGKSEQLRQAPSDALNGRYLFYLSSVQGIPLCLVAASEQMPTSSDPDCEKLRWHGHGWLIYPGAAKHLFSQSGKAKGDPGTPVSYTEDALFFTSDQERFVYYTSHEAGELLFLSDPLFPDRARQRREIEVRYGLQPAELYWNDRKTSGSVFYEYKRMPRSEEGFSEGRLEGFREGSRLYLLLSANDELLCVQREVDSPGEGTWFAILHDRRGRWEETYDVSVTEGESVEVTIQGWRLSATLSPVPSIQTPVETTEDAGTVSGAPPEPQKALVLWKSLGELPESRRKTPARFQVFRARVRIGSEELTMNGIGMMADRL
jgi:hypothetical protein